MTERRIPQDVVEGRPLGRHVNHDPRSLGYLVAETDTPASKSWRRYSPILDQGHLGSCVGNAVVGLLGTAPFYGRLAKQRTAGLQLDEAEAVSIYSAATQIDPWPEAYPPTDSGTDGLSGAKAAQAAGLITSYSHIVSLAAAHNAIKTGPFIFGTNWYSSFDTPDSAGVVKIGGTVRGGHEIEVVAYSLKRRMWKLANSWGPGWAAGGYFHLSDDTLTQLLAEQGDATVLNP